MVTPFRAAALGAVALGLSVVRADAQIASSEYAARRDSLAARVDSGIVVAFGGRTPVTDFGPFYQLPSFRYLTGYEYADAALVMVVRSGREAGRGGATLFVTRSAPRRSLYYGAEPDSADIARDLGLPSRPRDALVGVLDSLTAARLPFYVLRDYEDADFAALDSLTAGGQIMRALAQRHRGADVRDGAPFVERLRARKSAAELALIRRAAEISVAGHRAAMQLIAPGLHEYDLQAALESAFRRGGSERPAYGSIVGSGPNSTQLHYMKDRRELRAGDVVVIDAGAEYDGYAADVTRTLPVSGTFTPDQRAIYQIVRDAQAAAERNSGPGKSVAAAQDSSVDVRAQGLARLGLIEAPDAQFDPPWPADCARQPRACLQVLLFAIHGISHGLGLAVHDPMQGYYDQRVFEPGDAFTIEPGIYVNTRLLDILPDTPRNHAFAAKVRSAVERYRNIGVRIEDDYIVTPTGLEWITRAPREIAEVEAEIARRSQQSAAGPADTAARRPAVTKETLAAALQLTGLAYSDSDLDLLLRPRGQFGNDFMGRGDRRIAFDSVRAVDLPNSVPPALFFEPLAPAARIANRAPRLPPAPRGIRRPANLEDVAFWSIPRLAALLRSRQVTSVELTRMYLDRLRRFDPVLHAVVTLTDSLALEQARRADREIAAGRSRGLLEGIPFGVKDLYAVPGHPTTWGAEPYERQVLDQTATTVRKLEDAGAVLVAKLSTGALAMGDVWFRDTTRNPWNPKQGSSGSSAGPAAAVSAGLVPFALGTETLGSIVSPSTRTGVTGLRPSFGRVSRAGIMALAWSMDKAGPLCRDAEDCAIVFDVIRGRDPADPTTVDEPFPYDARARIAGMRVGYVKSAFDRDHRGADLDRAVLDVLRRLGATLVPIELPARPVQALRIILDAEAAASFDSLTRSPGIRTLRDQGPGAWPNTFRSARFIPAVEYLEANRVRRLLQQDMDTLLRRVDAYVSPSFGGTNLLVTNLTGHPCVTVPDGFMPDSTPTSITFCAPLYGEAAALEVARAYQDATPWDQRHPAAFAAAGP